MPYHKTTAFFCFSRLFKMLLAVVLLSCFLESAGQPPAGYYTQAENLCGNNLKNALHNIIRNHNTVSYSSLWEHFQLTDKRADNGKVWDIYSDNPGGTTGYYYTFGADQCGSYSSEGDCYNREHSVPKSWFGGSVEPMYTDLFHLYPTDGFVNAKRSNLPFGTVGSATWTSSNGSRTGICSYEGYNDLVFEPVDSFKGDLARTVFYMAVCYQDRNLAVETQSMFAYSNGVCAIKPWARKMLLKWCALDPVSTKEIDRNNAVYQIQRNRNPFIDFPDLADKVFGNDTNSLFTTGVETRETPASWLVFPNPTTGTIKIHDATYRQHDNVKVAVLDVFGNTVVAPKVFTGVDFSVVLPESASGVYFLRIFSDNETVVTKILKQ